MLKKITLLSILLAILAAVLYLYFSRPVDTQMLGLEPADSIDMSAADCDAGLNECMAAIGDKKLRLSLRPQPRPLQIFNVHLQAENWQPQQAVIYFTMYAMDMGLNRFRLAGKFGVYDGEAMLPVCTAGRSDWLAHVFVTDEGERYHAIFRFSTQ